MSKKVIIFALLLTLIPVQVLGQDKVSKEAEAQAQEQTLIYGGELNFNTRYVWRGLAWTDGPVLQPSAWIGGYGIEFSVWSNFVLYDENRRGKFDEVDLILLYSYEWNKLTIEPRFEYWMYFNQDDSPWTGEFSLKLVYNVIGTINVFTFHAFDIIKYRKSYYGEFGFSFGHDFLDNLSWTNELSFAWATSKYNDTYIGVSKNALEAVIFKTFVEYYILDYLYLRPHIELSILVDSDLRSQVNDPTLVSGGLAIGIDF